MKLVTASQMKELDFKTINQHKTPSLMLMEKAGEGVAALVRKLGSPENSNILVVAGRGNNGGDGLVVARKLILDGYSVTVLLLAGSSDLSPDAKANFELLLPTTTRVFSIRDTAELATQAPTIARSTCIVDAILGTGLGSDVSGLILATINLINSMKIPVVSVDIPSGLSADKGVPQGVAVRATYTVTFGLPKRGLILGDGPDYSGKIEVIDIGIPKNEVDSLQTTLELISPDMFFLNFNKRDPSSHKGTFGHALIFAGSLGHLGAGYLASMAALRAGCGLVSYALPAKSYVRFDSNCAELMCELIPDESNAYFHPAGLKASFGLMTGKQAIAIGPAIGTKKETREFVNVLVEKIKLPLVIDADGLNNLDMSSLKHRHAATILTPHPGEMARLCNTTADAIQNDRLGFSTRFAGAHNVIVILKGRGTIVAMPDGTAAINTTGNAGMATAGMGDALTGMLVSFLCQGMDPKTASVAAVYIHGLAGDMALKEHGERSLITSDLIKKLGEAIHEISV